jgi:hypothetical protein
VRGRAAQREHRDEHAARHRARRRRAGRGRRVSDRRALRGRDAGAHGFGLAMALVPPLLLALGAALRSPRRAALVPVWLLVAGALPHASRSHAISNGACISSTRASTSRWRCCSAAR